MKRHVLSGLLLLFTTIFFVSFSPVPTFAYSYYDEDENTDGTEADDEDDTEDDTENIANDEDDEDEGAFRCTARMSSRRDLVEEFIGYGVWPLAHG